ncbi:MAG TPA: membrane protein insertase YidC, partial [Nitrospiria bacterium]|nr:membrane protein insertase YidC [Nitrospiria bacterium]
MERNAVLFLILSISIIIGYSVLFPPAPPPKPAGNEAAPVSPPAEPATGAVVADAGGSSQATPSAAAPAVALPGEERSVVVETDLYRATLSSRGAVITSWRLNRYKDGPTKDTLIDLYTPPPQGGLSPLAVVLDAGDEATRAAFRSGAYAVDGGDLRLSSDHPSGTLKFETRGAGGETLVKRLTFHHDSYIVDVEVSTWGVPGAYRVVLGENFGIRQWGDASFVGYIGPTSLIDGKIIQDKPSKLEQPAVHDGRVSWTALQDKYFLTALIPTS